MQEDREDGEQGVEWVKVVVHYLGLIEKELTSLEAFNAKRKVVNQVSISYIPYIPSYIIFIKCK